VTADKAGDEGRVRLLKYLPRRRRLSDMSRLHHHYQIGERHGLVLTVGHVNETDAKFPLQALEFATHMFAKERIKRRQRLV
jgi:hypothetical protein